MSKKLTPRERAKIKIRKTIYGESERPRLTVYRSLNHIYAQLIDDNTGNTLVAASSLEVVKLDEYTNIKSKVSRSKYIGSMLARKAIEKNISTVVFDRNGYRYHGRVKALADGAREAGLKF